MLTESSSGGRIPNFGEMKGRRSTLAKRQLYINGFHRKLLKAPKMVLSKV